MVNVVALSDKDKEEFEFIIGELTKQDPKFMAPKRTLRPVYAGFIALIGLTLLVLGTALNNIFIGVGGFLLALAALAFTIPSQTPFFKHRSPKEQLSKSNKP